MTATMPILYSFRRCPYAMRARMAIAVSGQQVLLREVVLKDKPTAMLEASSKGTVPVLVLPSVTVIDESFDVMTWALQAGDPEKWLQPEQGSIDDMHRLIAECDGSFKHHLDRFKYATRYADADPITHRAAAGEFLAVLDARLGESDYLFGSRRSLADMAIFPFVRQFSGAAGQWFRGGSFPAVVLWLDALTSSALFTGIMKKYPQWQTGDAEPVFPEQH